MTDETAPGNDPVRNPAITAALRTHRPQLDMLVYLLERARMPGADETVWPADLPRSVGRALTLRNRTRNVAERERLFEADRDGTALTIGDLMTLRDFGTGSLIDLATTLQAMAAEQPREPDEADGTGDTDGSTRHEQESTAETRSPAEQVGTRLMAALEVARDTLGKKTLLDTLAPDLAAELKASSMAVYQTLRHTEIATLTEASRPIGQAHAWAATATVRQLYAAGTAGRRLAIKAWADGAPRGSAGERAKQLGISRERVYQLDRTVRRQIAGYTREDIDGAAQRVIAGLGSATDPDTLRSRITAEAPGAGIDAKVVRRLLQQRIRMLLGGDDEPSQGAVTRTLKRLRRRIVETADEAGLIAKETVESFAAEAARAGKTPEISSVTGDIAKRLGLHDLDPWWAVQGTNTARLTAMIRANGGPMTVTEIAGRTGMTPRNTRATLFRCAMLVRTSPRDWDLKSRADHEYQGIGHEIEHCINAAGGPVPTDEMARTLARKLKASAASVRSYLQSPLFKSDGKGYVTLASPETIRLQALEKTWPTTDDGGRPVWDITVTGHQPASRTFSQVPPAFGAAMGGELDERVGITIDSPGTGESALLYCPLRSPCGFLSGLGTTLDRLKPGIGNRIRITVTGHRRLAISITRKSDGD